MYFQNYLEIFARFLYFIIYSKKCYKKGVTKITHFCILIGFFSILHFFKSLSPFSHFNFSSLFFNNCNNNKGKNFYHLFSLASVMHTIMISKVSKKNGFMNASHIYYVFATEKVCYSTGKDC